MKSLQKLALASAVALTSAGAFAMQAMDDDSMSAATGQDGITLKIALPCFNAASCLPTASHGLSIDQIFVKDSNGFTALDSTGTAQTYVNPGFIMIGDGTLADQTSITTTSGQPISVLIDQTGNSGNTSGTAAAAANTDTPTLNVAVTVPAITIKTGTVYVTNGSDSSAATFAKAKIANSMTISTSGNTSLNIQLGAQPQGALVTVNTSIAGGLTLNNVGVHDGVLGGDINTATVTLTNAGGTALDVVAAVNVTTNAAPYNAYAPNGALLLKLAKLGVAGAPGSAIGTGVDVALLGTTLGNTATSAALGDVLIKGLNLNGTAVFVYGH